MGLRQHRFSDMLGCCRIDFQSFLREVVGSWRDHSAHMQHIVRSAYASQHIVVVHQITPNDTNALHVLKLRQLLFVDLAGSGQ